MSRESVLEWLQRRPFQPFQVRMSNGDVFVAGHPECGALSRNNLIIVNPDSDRWVARARLHIAAIAPADVGQISSVP
jgi:hypothetical protein